MRSLVAFASRGKKPLMRPGRILADIEQSEHLPLAARFAARSTNGGSKGPRCTGAGSESRPVA
jgi:hypothetical protein